MCAATESFPSANSLIQALALTNFPKATSRKQTWNRMSDLCLRALINGSSTDSKHAIKSEPVTLQQLYRKSLITSIKISERMALEAELLMEDPGKLAQLM